MKKETIIVIAIAAAIIVGNWLFLGSRDKAPEGEVADSSADDFVAVTKGSETRSDATKETDIEERLSAVPSAGNVRDVIRVEDQAPGTVVKIAELRFMEMSWVVVHEDRDRAPGNILGAQRLRPTDTAGTVDLLRAIEDGKLYYAMIHTDDGDNAFDPAKDTPKKDENGNVVMVRFAARVAGSVAE